MKKFIREQQRQEIGTDDILFFIFFVAAVIFFLVNFF